MKSCLIVAPHPDDETLGCGGIISNLKTKKIPCNWLICTKGLRNWNKKQVHNRERIIKRISDFYQFNSFEQLDFYSAELNTDSIKIMIEKIKQIIHKNKIDTIFLPHPEDIHSDHNLVFKAGFGASKWFRSNYVRTIFCYETCSETEFSPAGVGSKFYPNTWIDISNSIKEKEEALKIYVDEINSHPFPRSIENIISLAKFRGSRVGYKYAEAFQLIFQNLDL